MGKLISQKFERDSNQSGTQKARTYWNAHPNDFHAAIRVLVGIGLNNYPQAWHVSFLVDAASNQFNDALIVTNTGTDRTYYDGQAVHQTFTAHSQ